MRGLNLRGKVGAGDSESNSTFLKFHLLILGAPNFSTHKEMCTFNKLTQLSKAKGLRNYSPMASGSKGMKGVKRGQGGGREVIFFYFDSAPAHRAPSGLWAHKAYRSCKTRGCHYQREPPPPPQE